MKRLLHPPHFSPLVWLANHCHVRNTLFCMASFAALKRSAQEAIASQFSFKNSP